MTKNNIPIARRFLSLSNRFKQKTGAEEAQPFTGDPLSVTASAKSRPAIPGQNYKNNMYNNIQVAKKIVSKITLYNPNDTRVINGKFTGIKVVSTGKTLKKLPGVKLFRLEYGNNVNNQKFGTYIYMAEWVPGVKDGITIDVTEDVAKEMSKIEEEDQRNQMNENRRRNGGKKTKKRKMKSKRKKRKTIRNKKK